MATFQIQGATIDAQAASSTTPLVVLFERDDAVAVPLLSQLRMAGYDVRASRTPVELFDILSKQPVSLVLVDLGNATAGRREFWVALDGQRCGRALQVMTFRYIAPSSILDMDFEPSARALADVEVHNIYEFQRIIEGVQQRIPLHGSVSVPGASGATSMPSMSAPQAPAPFGSAAMAQPGGAAAGMLPVGIAPIGAALGVPSPFMQQPGASAYAQSYEQPYAAPAAPQPTMQPGFVNPPAQQAPSAQAFPPAQPMQPGFALPGMQSPSPFASPAAAPTMQPGFIFPGADPAAASPFAHPVPANPFAAAPALPMTPKAPAPIASSPAGRASEASPFAQPYTMNPFADDAAASDPYGKVVAHPFVAEQPMMSPWEASLPPVGNAQPAYAPFSREEYAHSYEPHNNSMGMSGVRTGFASFATSEPPSSPPRQEASDRYGRHGGYGTSLADGRAGAPIADVWTPPESDDDNGSGFDPTADTGIVPEMAYLPVGAARKAPAQARVNEKTAPVSAQTRLPMKRPETPAESALSTVLVEGALITPHKLDALKGIQQMLASVEVDLKLGELALLFNFLSPDQLLAALLVSRGLVSPQQIAGLGRVKQELAGSGMDYDLETLLVMFHILPAEQLHQLRAELA